MCMALDLKNLKKLMTKIFIGDWDNLNLLNGPSLGDKNYCLPLRLAITWSGIVAQIDKAISRANLSILAIAMINVLQDYLVLLSKFK